MPRRPGLKWGDTRVAFFIIAHRVQLALRAGRSVKSVYEELKPFFPGSYSQFARYVQKYASRTTVRETTDRASSPHVDSASGDEQRKKGGPLEIAIGPPARFKHNPDPDSWKELI